MRFATFASKSFLIAKIAEKVMPSPQGRAAGPGVWALVDYLSFMSHNTGHSILVRLPFFVSQIER